MNGNALALLLKLQLFGWLRYLGQGLGTVRGAVTAAIGGAAFLGWMATLLFARDTGSGLKIESVTMFGPAVLLAYCLANVLFSPSDRALHFSLPEVQFLFAGPFTRRQVLAYKLALTLLVSLPATLILLLALRIRGAWAPALVVGVLLSSVFMQLFSIVLGLLRSAVGIQLFSQGRRVAGGVALAVVLLLVVQAGLTEGGGWDASALALRVFDSAVWRALTWPLRSFFDVMAAESFWSDMLLPLGVAVALNLLMLGLIFGLDAHFLEASAAASARLYARIQQLRGKNVEMDEPLQGRAAAAPRVGVPMLPYWGGVGPVLWRQMTSAVRGMGRLGLVLLILGVSAAVPMTMAQMDRPASAPAPGDPRGSGELWLVMLLGLMVSYVTLFLTALVPFDFRGDVDRIATLRTLPIPTWRVTLGQLLVPTLLLSVVQMAAFVTGAVMVPKYALYLAVAALYVTPMTFVLIGLENFLFLLFPVRLMANTPGDFQAVGRNLVLMLGKMLGLGIVVTAVLVPALLVGALTGSVMLGALVGLPVVLAADVALVPLVGLAFEWFDVGRDTPA